MTATFVSSTKTPDDTIYVVVKAVFDNFDRFKNCIRPLPICIRPT